MRYEKRVSGDEGLACAYSYYIGTALPERPMRAVHTQNHNER